MDHMRPARGNWSSNIFSYARHYLLTGERDQGLNEASREKNEAPAGEAPGLRGNQVAGAAAASIALPVTLIPDRDGAAASRVLSVRPRRLVVPNPDGCLGPQARVPPRLGFLLSASMRSPASGGPLWRTGHTAAAVVLAQKSVLNLRIDPVEPLLRAIGSFSMRPNLSFQLRDPIFGRSELMGKLLRHLNGMLTVCFGHAGGLVKQLQNGLSCFVGRQGMRGVAKNKRLCAMEAAQAC
jgi:hypothetical protein